MLTNPARQRQCIPVYLALSSIALLASACGNAGITATDTSRIEATLGTCGNNECEPTSQENCNSCPADCGRCRVGVGYATAISLKDEYRSQIIALAASSGAGYTALYLTRDISKGQSSPGEDGSFTDYDVQAFNNYDAGQAYNPIWWNRLAEYLGQCKADDITVIVSLYDFWSDGGPFGGYNNFDAVDRDYVTRVVGYLDQSGVGYIVNIGVERSHLAAKGPSTAFINDCIAHLMSLGVDLKEEMCISEEILADHYSADDIVSIPGYITSHGDHVPGTQTETPVRWLGDARHMINDEENVGAGGYPVQCTGSWGSGWGGSGKTQDYVNYLTAATQNGAIASMNFWHLKAFNNCRNAVGGEDMDAVFAPNQRAALEQVCGVFNDCVPGCANKECGPDGCGGECSPGCNREVCDESTGQCGATIYGLPLVDIINDGAGNEYAVVDIRPILSSGYRFDTTRGNHAANEWQDPRPEDSDMIEINRIEPFELSHSLGMRSKTIYTDITRGSGFGYCDPTDTHDKGGPPDYPNDLAGYSLYYDGGGWVLALNELNRDEKLGGTGICQYESCPPTPVPGSPYTCSCCLEQQPLFYPSASRESFECLNFIPEGDIAAWDWTAPWSQDYPTIDFFAPSTGAGIDTNRCGAPKGDLDSKGRRRTDRISYGVVAVSLAGASCPDGICSANETCESCAQDCGSCPPDGGCGDGVCNGGENSASCPQDCGTACAGDEEEWIRGARSCSSSTTCATVCANAGYDYCVRSMATCEGEPYNMGSCASSETGDAECAERGLSSCDQVSCRCGRSACARCGDGICDGNETCESCAQDCGSCPPVVLCGNGSCNGTETCQSCEQDCGPCPPTAFCGDGSCNDTETCSSCQQDCGPCPPESYCGDGVCNSGENTDSCPQDCGSCSGQEQWVWGALSCATTTACAQVCAERGFDYCVRRNANCAGGDMLHVGDCSSTMTGASKCAQNGLSCEQVNCRCGHACQ